MAEPTEHEVKIQVKTEYFLTCSCGWKVMCYDIFESEGLRQYHLRRMVELEQRAREVDEGDDSS